MTDTRPGRRPGNPGTRDQIVAAARAAFAAQGLEATSLRAVARAAGVDAALVHHYFRSKQELFVASTDLPIDPAALLTGVAADPDRAGELMAGAFLAMLDDADARQRLLAILRAAATDEAAAASLRGLIHERVARPAAEALAADHPSLRATLVGSQLVGLAFARHVVGVEPLASTPAEVLAAAVGPTLQRYLTGAIA